MGATKITDTQRKNYSKRAFNLKINIIKKNCKFCGHKKAISKPKGLFCTSCKRRLK